MALHFINKFIIYSLLKKHENIYESKRREDGFYLVSIGDMTYIIMLSEAYLKSVC